MKRWEKMLFIFFMLVILAISWYAIRVANSRVHKRFSVDPLVTQSMDSAARVSKED